MKLLLAPAGFVVSERNDPGLVLDLVVFLAFVVAHILIELLMPALILDKLPSSRVW